MMGLDGDSFNPRPAVRPGATCSRCKPLTRTHFGKFVRSKIFRMIRIDRIRTETGADDRFDGSPEAGQATTG